MNNIAIVIIVILVCVLAFIVYKYKTKETFCVDRSQGLDYESYYNSGHLPEEIYKGTTMESFLDKVKKDKNDNHSILGSVQNPMSDRNNNTRILYQAPEQVYKF